MSSFINIENLMKNKLFFLTLFLFFLCLYALTLRGESGNPKTATQLGTQNKAAKAFESSHERANYAQLLSIVNYRRLDLTKDFADFSAPDVGYYKGKFYNYFPPGVTFLIIPFFLLGQRFNLAQLFAYATIPLLAVLTMIFIYKIARHIFKLPFWASLTASLIFAFATTSWSYAVTIYQHIPAAFFATCCFYAAWKYKQKWKYGWIYAIIVWFMYGTSFLFDYPNAILLLPIMVYFLLSSFYFDEKDSKHVVSFRLVFALTFFAFIGISALHALYNDRALGNWKQFTNTLPRYEIKNLKNIQANSEKTAAKKSQINSIFQEQNGALGFYELIVAPDKSIFLFSPILVLAILGFIRWVRKLDAEKGTVVALIGTNLFLYASFGDPWGGWAFGPRYLIPSMPFLAIMVMYWLSHAKYKIISRIVAFVLFTTSAAIALLGAITTNLVPPKVEADYFHMKYNFLLNIDYLKAGKSSSFAFNEFFSRYMNLTQYYFFILAMLLIVAAFILFILPKYERK